MGIDGFESTPWKLWYALLISLRVASGVWMYGIEINISHLKQSVESQSRIQTIQSEYQYQHYWAHSPCLDAYYWYNQDNWT